MASTTNGENVGGDDTVVTNNPTASATAADNTDGSGSPTKPKRPRGRGRGRKGSLMFTPSGSYGLGTIPTTPSNIIPSTATTSHSDTVGVTSTNTITTTNGKDSDDNELLVDFPTANDTTSTNNVETAPKDNSEVPPTSTPLSGDHYVSMLLKAEIEGNSREVADLQRRGSCMIRPGGIGGLGMEGFQDDDSDDDGLTRRSSQPGSADHRPLVGGFAAAAYEAAREYHYSQKKNEKNSSDKDSGNVVRNMPPPSI